MTISQDYKLIVAGGRDYRDYERMKVELSRLIREELMGYDVSIVSGMANGADSMGFHYAEQYAIRSYQFLADWDNVDVPGAWVKKHANGRLYNARAGHQRNAEMARFSDGLIAFWDGRSRGTLNMIETMKGLGKLVRIVDY